MSAKMRRALELIASGVGPIGGRLGYDQMREIAREAIAPGAESPSLPAAAYSSPPRLSEIIGRMDELARSFPHPTPSVTIRRTPVKTAAKRPGPKSKK